MILLSKARFCDFSHRGYGNGFFEIGRGNYMTIASKPNIPFLWGIFLRLGSSSSCLGKLSLVLRQVETFSTLGKQSLVVSHGALFGMFANNTQ